MRTGHKKNTTGIPSKAKTRSFLWEGLNKAGHKVKGELDASHISAVKIELRRQGIVLKRVKKKPIPFLQIFRRRTARVVTSDVVIFSRQMATMVNASIPLAQALGIVGRGQTNPTMQSVISRVKEEVETGNSFAEALRKQPAYFDDFFCSLVHVGEQSGSLETMLDRVATYKEKTESLKNKIKKAMFYPGAVVTVAFFISAILFIFFLQQFETVFKSFGAELPLPTRIVIKLSRFFQSYWWLMFISVGMSIWGFATAKRRSIEFARFLDRLKLKLPILGNIIQKAILARVARTLSITFGAGLPLVDALDSVATAAGNSVYADVIQKIRFEVSAGQQLNVAMRESVLFPSMMVQMIAIGEESGALEHMLSKIASFYEEAVDNAADSLSSLLEPVIMVVLGIIVGGLIIAMYLPIFKLGGVIS